MIDLILESLDESRGVAILCDNIGLLKHTNMPTAAAASSCATNSSRGSSPLPLVDREFGRGGPAATSPAVSCPWHQEIGLRGGETWLSGILGRSLVAMTSAIRNSAAGLKCPVWPAMRRAWAKGSNRECCLVCCKHSAHHGSHSSDRSHGSARHRGDPGIRLDVSCVELVTEVFAQGLGRDADHRGDVGLRISQPAVAPSIWR